MLRPRGCPRRHLLGRGARTQHPGKTLMVPMHDVDRTIADGEVDGFVKIHVQDGTESFNKRSTMDKRVMWYGLVYRPWRHERHGDGRGNFIPNVRFRANFVGIFQRPL